ncbi:Lsr2 family protein (plasmid) [Streptomyces sp. NBC_00708]
MFADWQQALDAEGLPLNPNTDDQRAAATRTIARHATSNEDLVLLLNMTGLPSDDDNLTALLPLIPDTGDAPAMTHPTSPPAPSARDAAVRHTSGTTAQTSREASGLSDARLRDVILDQPRTHLTPPAAETIDVEQLLAWAASHPAASVRRRAARITADLTDLTGRHHQEAAQREAEAQVAKAKAELEKAQAVLHTLKTGPRATTTPTTSPTSSHRSGLGSGRTREELAAIRKWARANGYKVADAGMVPKTVVEAYDAAHRTPTREES